MRITTRTAIALAGARRATRSVTRVRRYTLAALAALASLVVGAGLAAAPPAQANVQPPIGAPRPILTISPNPKNFGSLFVGETSSPVVFTVRNATLSTARTATTAPLAVFNVPLDPAGNNAFGVVQDTCTGTALVPGASCSVSVVFHPQVAGLAVAGILVEVPNCFGSRYLCPAAPGRVYGTGVLLTD